MQQVTQFAPKSTTIVLSFFFSFPFSKKMYTTVKTNCTKYGWAILSLRKTREVTLGCCICGPDHSGCASSVKRASTPFSGGFIWQPLWQAGPTASRQLVRRWAIEEKRSSVDRRPAQSLRTTSQHLCPRRRRHRDGEITQRWPPSYAGQCKPQCQPPAVLRGCCWAAVGERCQPGGWYANHAGSTRGASGCHPHLPGDGSSNPWEAAGQGGCSSPRSNRLQFASPPCLWWRGRFHLPDCVGSWDCHCHVRRTR